MLIFPSGVRGAAERGMLDHWAEADAPSRIAIASGRSIVFIIMISVLMHRFQSDKEKQEPVGAQDRPKQHDQRQRARGRTTRSLRARSERMSKCVSVSTRVSPKCTIE